MWSDVSTWQDNQPGRNQTGGSSSMLGTFVTAAKWLLRSSFIAMGMIVIAHAEAQEFSAERPQTVSQPATSADRRVPAGAKPTDFNSAIQHIVFIIKENRSFNEMFGALE